MYNIIHDLCRCEFRYPGTNPFAEQMHTQFTRIELQLQNQYSTRACIDMYIRKIIIKFGQTTVVIGKIVKLLFPFN